MPNLKTYELAFVDDDNEVSWALRKTAPIIMVPTNPITPNGISRLVPIAAIHYYLTPLACEGETSVRPVYTSKYIAPTFVEMTSAS